MARATFEGPILAGDQRFGALRNVGYVDLVQAADIDLTVTTNGAANYGGASGQFVNANGIPNTNAVVYTSSSSVYPSVAATIPADNATNIYRGAVAYLPFGSAINDIFVDIGVVPAVTSGTLTSTTIYVSNGFTAAAGTAAYANTAVLTSPAVGRQSLATFTATQLANQSSTSADILTANGAGTGPNASKLSQVVFTVAIVGTSLTTPITGGKFYFTVRYTQLDGSIGSTTAYPYGNFD
jgi:hypothetical protein